MKILVAVDGSPNTQKVLDYLARHRAMFVDGHALIVVHVCPGVPGHVARHLHKGLITDYYAEEAARVVEPVKAALARHDISGFSVDLRHGRTAEQILQAASASGAELIVLGTRGHGIFGRSLMGSVAAKVLSVADMPVLMVQ
jgi:nucleotide-binding universal stress UspA family protein